MSFHPHSTKLAHEIVFSRKKGNVHYPPITFNNIAVKSVQSYKRLGLTLDPKLDFHELICSIFSKVNKLTALQFVLFT